MVANVSHSLRVQLFVLVWQSLESNHSIHVESFVTVVASNMIM